MLLVGFVTILETVPISQNSLIKPRGILIEPRSLFTHYAKCTLGDGYTVRIRTRAGTSVRRESNLQF